MEKLISTVDKIDKLTGEVTSVQVSPVQIIKSIPFKTDFDGHSSPEGDDEVNKGPYLVDETGYCDLQTLFKRSLQQGTFSPFYDGEFDIDESTDISSFDEDISAEAPKPSPSEGASSSEVSADTVVSAKDVQATIPQVSNAEL